MFSVTRKSEYRDEATDAVRTVDEHVFPAESVMAAAIRLCQCADGTYKVTSYHGSEPPALVVVADRKATVSQYGRSFVVEP